MIVLQNSTVMDRTVASPYAADILIHDGEIAQIGNIQPTESAQVIDRAGLIAAALGFIDIHSHSDLQVLANHRAKTDQGVTTEVAGNCGFSPYPFGEDRTALHQFADGIFCGWDDWG